MPIKFLKKKVRDRAAITLLCVGLGAFGAGGVAALDRVSTDADQASQEAAIAKSISSAVQHGVEESCERFGNSLRFGLRQFFKAELVKSQTTAFDKFFPNIPQTVLDKARAEEANRLEYDIKTRFKDVPCKEQYAVDHNRSGSR